MHLFLRTLNKKVDAADSAFAIDRAEKAEKIYDAILKKADVECPAPCQEKARKKHRKIKRSKSRNLLERLINYKSDVLRFMHEPAVPFSNNRAENDLRMTN